MCWHSSGGSAVDTLRIPFGRRGGPSVIAGGRMATRLEAPGQFTQLYVGAVVCMDKGWKDHTNVCIVPARWRRPARHRASTPCDRVWASPMTDSGTQIVGCRAARSRPHSRRPDRATLLLMDEALPRQRILRSSLTRFQCQCFLARMLALKRLP